LSLRDVQTTDAWRAFGRGFRQRSPLVLVAACGEVTTNEDAGLCAQAACDDGDASAPEGAGNGRYNNFAWGSNNLVAHAHPAFRSGLPPVLHFLARCLPVEIEKSVDQHRRPLFRALQSHDEQTNSPE